MKLNMKKYFKGIATAILSLGIIASSVIPASATTSQFREDYYSYNGKVAKETAKAIHRETKNLSTKKRVQYYDKVLNKIVKDSKKAENTELQIMSIFTDVQSKLSYREDLISKKEYKKYYHKDPGVYAINSGYADSKGYAYVLRDALVKAKFKADILSTIEYVGFSGRVFWVSINLNGKYYHLDPYRSDLDDTPKNNEYFLLSGKSFSLYGNYKLKKPYTNTDNRYEGFKLLDSTRILKETKTHYYSMYLNQDITKVSKKGKGEIIYNNPDDHMFIAEKNGWLYGRDSEKNIFFKIHINDVIAKKDAQKSIIKIMDLNPKLHDQFEVLSEDYITVVDKNGNRIKYVLGN